MGEPVWPSGKALGPRLDTASALLSLHKGCGLWTPSCMALIAAHLNAGIILVVTV